MIGDKDDGARADTERDYRAELGMKVSEDWFDFRERFAKPVKVADDRKSYRAWRKIGFALGEDDKVDEGFEKGGNGD